MDFNNDSGTLSNVSVLSSSATNTVTLQYLGGAILPTGATADRPAIPTAGTFRYNITSNKTEYWNGALWKQDIANLSECADAVITSPLANQVLLYNGTRWVNSSSSAPAVGSGAILQSITSSIAASTGTSTNTLANTTPVSTTGTQVWSQIITPSAATSKIIINGSVVVSHASAARYVELMVFRGTTCIGVTIQYIATAATLGTIPILFVDQPAATTAQTYTMRVAGSGSGSWYVGQGPTAYFNGMLALSGIITQELA